MNLTYEIHDKSIGSIEEILSFSKQNFTNYLDQRKQQLALDNLKSTTTNTDSKEYWQSLIQDHNGHLFIARNDKQVIALVFTFQKVLNKQHIWLAITHPDYHRLGIMKALFQKVQDHFTNQNLTVNTIPEIFPNMPKFLQSLGFDIVNRKTVEGPFGALVEKIMLEKQSSTSPV
ncbi:hypothetical protein BC833DRAFT_597576 [Globomyces pollinis-pini]|nr:hypothetical protein BC833DRAFT_597576 [Globomyces pollinis-pini]